MVNPDVAGRRAARARVGMGVKFREGGKVSPTRTHSE